jgi:hypothetical protein
VPSRRVVVASSSTLVSTCLLTAAGDVHVLSLSAVPYQSSALPEQCLPRAVPYDCSAFADLSGHFHRDVPAMVPKFSSFWMAVETCQTVWMKLTMRLHVQSACVDDPVCHCHAIRTAWTGVKTCCFQFVLSLFSDRIQRDVPLNISMISGKRSRACKYRFRSLVPL